MATKRDQARTRQQFAKSIDKNHGPIRSALRAAGWTVIDTFRAPGMLDMCASRQGCVVFLEVKNPKAKKQELTDMEVAFMADHQGFAAVVKEPLDAIERCVAFAEMHYDQTEAREVINNRRVRWGKVRLNRSLQKNLVRRGQLDLMKKRG